MKKLIIGTAVISTSIIIATVIAAKVCKSKSAGQWTDGPTLSVSVEDILKSRNAHEGVGF